MKTIFPKTYVYVLRTTKTRHMVSFIDFYFPFSSKFSDLNCASYVLYNLPVLCHLSHIVSLGYLCLNLNLTVTFITSSENEVKMKRRVISLIFASKCISNVFFCELSYHRKKLFYLKIFQNNSKADLAHFGKHEKGHLGNLQGRIQDFPLKGMRL